MDDTLRAHLRPDIPISPHPMHIKAPEFAAAVVDRYLALASPKGQPQ